MNLLFASDSFKGSLSSDDTARLLTKAAEENFPGCTIKALPMADGGEGTAEAVIRARGGERVEVPVHGPLMEDETGFYGRLSDDEAIFEMASASGLPLLDESELDPLKTTTYGTGELFKSVLDSGASKVAIAIGGSATNDGGMGFARALGIRFLDVDGRELEGRGEDLEKVADIDPSGLDPRIRDVSVTVMCDVTNPLCGPEGATMTFGGQKGGSPEVLDRLEKGMENYREVIIRRFGVDPDSIPGSGAAGGLGAALCVFLGAGMRSGIDTVLDLVGFDSYLEDADLVVTGEGRTDWQSCCGKVLQGVGDRAKRHGVPAVALCGSLGPGYEAIYDHGILSLMTTVDAPMTLSRALENAEPLYYKAAQRLFRMLKAAK